jgi:hypothetical protein
VEIKYKKTKIIPDYFEVGRFLIVSERLKNYLVKNDVNGQYLKVDLNKNGNKSEDENYYMFNLLDKVDCFDFKRSKYEGKAPDNIEAIDKLVLGEVKNCPNMFVVEKVYVPNYILTENFKKVLENEKFSGMEFVKLKDYMC